MRTVAEALGALLLILLSTFFLLRDGDEIWGWTLRLFPQRRPRSGWTSPDESAGAPSAATCAARC